MGVDGGEEAGFLKLSPVGTQLTKCDATSATFHTNRAAVRLVACLNADLIV